MHEEQWVKTISSTKWLILRFMEYCQFRKQFLLDDLLDKLKLVLAEHFRFLSGKDNLFLYIFWKYLASY